MLVSLAVVSDIEPSSSSAHLLAISASSFEVANDGNQVVGTGTDWVSALTAGPPPSGSTTGSTISPNLFRLIELESGTKDNSLAGGVKDDTECPPSTTGSIPPTKDDMERMYLYHETKTVNGVTNTFLYLGYVRALPSGTTSSAHAVFELNKLNQKCPNTVKGNKVTISDFYVREPGDVRVAFDDAGGNSPEVSIQRWQEPCLAGGAGCWSGKTTLTSSQAEGDFNDVTITDRLHLDEQLGQQRFSEVKINMNAAGLLTAGSCTGFGAAGLFSGASGNTDNEQSKDYIAPQPINLNFCRDLVIQKNDDDANLLSGVEFRVVEDFPNGAPAFGAAEQTAYASPTVKSCTTVATTGQCTITALDTGKSYWIVEHLKPAGYGDDPGALDCTVATGVVKKCRLIAIPSGTGTFGPTTGSTGSTFTNPRLFKVVTFVCIKTDNTLYAAEATYDDAVLTGTNNTATTVTAAVQSAICGMTGTSVHDNVTYGLHSANKANIPQ